MFVIKENNYMKTIQMSYFKNCDGKYIQVYSSIFKSRINVVTMNDNSIPLSVHVHV